MERPSSHCNSTTRSKSSNQTTLPKTARYTNACYTHAWQLLAAYWKKVFFLSLKRRILPNPGCILGIQGSYSKPFVLVLVVINFRWYVLWAVYDPNIHSVKCELAADSLPSTASWNNSGGHKSPHWKPISSKIFSGTIYCRNLPLTGGLS